MKKALTITAAALAIVVGVNAIASSPKAPSTLQSSEQALLKANPTMDKKALDTALCAYEHLRADGKDTQQMLTFINYAKPDYQKRLWVINMRDNKVMYNTLVAQGKNTGTVNAKHFSDDPRSLESSIGVFLTGNTYSGEHGYSLRLHGLDKGFNDKAYQRDVVMHSAWYVSNSFVKKYHRVGRSWGCPALSQKMEPKVVSAIKDGTVLVSYYPNQHWLDSSKYLTA